MLVQVVEQKQGCGDTGKEDHSLPYLLIRVGKPHCAGWIYYGWAAVAAIRE